MSRKSVLVPFKAIDAGDMSAQIISTESDLQYQDNCCYQVYWSGTAPLGELFVDVTSDDINLNPAPVWTPLDFGQQITISGNSGNHFININQFPGKTIRLRYEPDGTPGTGSLTAIITSKQAGG